jgi:twitching motility two-component system response regulator PilG
MKPEIAPAKILNHIAECRSTGQLEVFGAGTRWRIAFQSGQLVIGECSVRSLGQLSQRLQQLGWDLAAKIVNTAENRISHLSGNLPVQQEIARLVTQGLLVPSQASQVSTEVTKEALESLLWLKNGQFKWQPDRLAPSTAIENSTARLDLLKLIEYYQQRLVIWQKFITIVQSPHQRPYLLNQRYSAKPVANGILSPIALGQIAQLMQGISLRELALWLKQDELRLVQLLVPYIRESVICLREPAEAFKQLPLIPEPDLSEISIGDELKSAGDTSNSTSAAKIYKIACIDDSPFILDEIGKILGKNSQYSLTKIEDPIAASAQIFRLKPDLILMDITMPEINGYKLCRLFRSSAAFETTPIIMVTGNKGLLDKGRAKLVGATDYLTKPFTQQELLELVGKYLVGVAKIIV